MGAAVGAAVVGAVCAAAVGAAVGAAVVGAVCAAAVGAAAVAAYAAPSAAPPFLKGWIGLIADQTAPLCSAAASWYRENLLPLH